MKLQSAAVIIPCNSFLKGQDICCEGIASRLTSIGYDLKKISIVEENHKSVIHELEILFKMYDIVLILTTENPNCVSNALASLTSQEQTLHLALSIYNNKKHIMWPQSIKSLESECNMYSVLYIQRIFILRMGFVEKQFSLILEEHLQQYGNDSTFSKVFSIPSKELKKIISIIQNKCLGTKFELYDTSTEEGLLKVFSDNFESIVNAEKLIKDREGSSDTSDYWINSMCNTIYFHSDKHIKNAIQIIEKCFEEYGLNVFLSFNGGKDCTVLLHLIQTVIEKKYFNKKKYIRLYCLYVRSELAFKEQDEFVDQCRIFYNLEVLTITSNIKAALEITLKSNPDFKACFMGTRRTDPYSVNLRTFEITDPDWPQVMRCNPLLDWSYADIWDYLLYYKVPYCKLYDYGYTSLGNVTDTVQNPNLFHGNDGKGSFLPAYKLLNGKNERIGRNNHRT